LHHFVDETAKKLEECDERDIQNFLIKHCRTGGTWNMWLSTLRQFFAWYFNKDRHLPKKKWKPPAFFELLEWKSDESSKYQPEDMWTEEEILMAISVLDHPRDKAIVALAYDLAARPVEFMKLKIRNIILRENYAQVKLIDHSNLEGRVLPITIAFPYLLQWLNCHPLKDQDSAPLWVRTTGVPKALSYHSVYGLCTKVLRRRLGHKIQKPFNPYCMFDHSRLTNLVGKGLTEFELKQFRGWKPNSTMPRRYIHMSGKELNERMLELAGIKKPELGEKESPLKAKECYRCHQNNAPDAKYCQKCNFVLSAEAFEEMKEKEMQRNEQFENLQKFASFQMHMFAEHGGKPSKKCAICKKSMEELSTMSFKLDGMTVA